MNEQPVGVIVCGRDGRIRSATPEAHELLGGDALEAGASLADGFAAAPGLARWVEGALARGGPARMFQTGVIAATNAPPLRVYLTVLPDGGSDGEVALALTRVTGTEDVVLPHDVARKTWHDIQNQLGGLKLYATFLKKKLGTADDQVRETAEKIVMGVDAVSQSIANARRGEGGTQ
jgi:nitrogen fixation/metabolism regulation signal transduction histidine kinase